MGRRRLQHAELARRERSDDAEHEHAGLLQRGHVDHGPPRDLPPHLPAPSTGASSAASPRRRRVDDYHSTSRSHIARFRCLDNLCGKCRIQSTQRARKLLERQGDRDTRYIPTHPLS